MKNFNCIGTSPLFKVILMFFQVELVLIFKGSEDKKRLILRVKFFSRNCVKIGKKAFQPKFVFPLPRFLFTHGFSFLQFFFKWFLELLKIDFLLNEFL